MCACEILTKFPHNYGVQQQYQHKQLNGLVGRTALGFAWASLLLLLASPAFAEQAVGPSPIRLSPTSPGPAHWQAQLDLRTLPAETMPGTVRAHIDLRSLPPSGDPVRVTLSINGFVMSDRRSRGGTAMIVSGRIERRFLSTRNQIEVSVQAVSSVCATRRCPVAQAELGAIDVALDGDLTEPRSFAEFVTLLRPGLHIQAPDPRAGVLAEPAIAALAPFAPRTDGAAARIIIGQHVPRGTEPHLRFDRGPVELRDRDGRLLLSATRLSGLTAVQMLQDDTGPVLWIRPGDHAWPDHMDLDQGQLALFEGNHRLIAFSPNFDEAVTITYPVAESTRPLMTLWQGGIVLAWLALTLGLTVAWRRIGPVRAEGAVA